MEPVWRPKSQFFTSDIDPVIASWLLDPNSLTERLIRECTGQFSVRVLFQGWGRPMANEARRLDMTIRSLALIRQVHLLSNDQPLVYARTIIPPQTLRGKQRRLLRLGQKPLGAVLFADKSMHRTEMELARITPDLPLYQHANSHSSKEAGEIWGRRSVFYLQDKPLLVSEIFLPSIKQNIR